MILNLSFNCSQIFLKFCYLLFFVLLLSCKGDVSKKESKTQIDIDKKENISTSSSDNSKTILFFGDSLTAGYGLDDVNNAYPGVIDTMLDSLGLDFSVVNAGLSGETTAGGNSRIKWVLNQKVDIFILALGANDGLRGVPLKETKENLQSIIDVVYNHNPNTIIILAGMQIPPNMGQTYASEFKSIFPDLTKKNNLKLVPFLLKDVGGIPELNQADGIHPTIEGQKILANNVWAVLETVIGT